MVGLFRAFRGSGHFSRVGQKWYRTVLPKNTTALNLNLIRQFRLEIVKEYVDNTEEILDNTPVIYEFGVEADPTRPVIFEHLSTRPDRTRPNPSRSRPDPTQPIPTREISNTSGPDGTRPARFLARPATRGSGHGPRKALLFCWSIFFQPRVVGVSLVTTDLIWR